MRVTLVISIVAGLMIGLICAPWIDLRTAQSQESKTAKPVDAAAELEDLQESAAAFAAAFNKGDATAIAEQFGENAEVVDDDGNVVQGRENIRARFAEVFKTNPDARISVEVKSLRKLGPDVAVEDGISTTIMNPDDAVSRSPYTLIHLKRNGKWAIASVRDFPEETEATPHDQLLPLAWLVGEWVDQSDDAKVETSCKWTDDGNYLIQEYVVKLHGGPKSQGTQRIGWDPVRRTIRAWAFDQSGGYVESTWTPVEDAWIIKAEGVTADGKQASATRMLSPLGVDLFRMDSTQRLFGQELLPDSSVRVVRRPPSPSTTE